MSNFDINSIEYCKKYIKDLEMIFDNFPGLIFQKDDKNNLIRVNKYMADAHETTKEALVGKSCFDIYPKDVAQKYFDDDQEVIKSKKPKLNFIEPWDIVGERRWMNTNKIPLFDDDGKCIGIIGFCTDVTVQVKAEEKLKQASEQLNTIFSKKAMKYFDIAGVILVVLNKEGNIELLNKRAYKILQYTEDELIGRNWFETCIPKQHRGKTYDIFKKLMQNELETTELNENTILTKNGEEKIIAWHNLLLFDSKGEINGTFSSGEDITAQKKAEVEIVNLARFPSENPNPVLRVTKEKVIYVNKAAEELFETTKDDKLPELFRSLVYDANDGCISISSEVELNKNNFSLKIFPIKEEGYVNIYGMDITAHKTVEVELRKTMLDLERSNNDLEQFASIASHDLQEPLRMVTGFTQLLQDRYKDKLDEDANDFINYAIDGATRMKNLIDDLLIFSRIGSRGKPFKLIEMNIALEIVLSNLGHLIEETHSAITSDPLPVIKADETQMIQLFQNLISNAIKFRGEKTPAIHVTAEIKTDMWTFSVQDNGIGIDSKYFDKIFIIFQRLHKKKEYDGTGIGLAVCKKIIQRHSGKIWVESELGKGSTFHFSIKKKKSR